MHSSFIHYYELKGRDLKIFIVGSKVKYVDIDDKKKGKYWCIKDNQESLVQQALWQF